MFAGFDGCDSLYKRSRVSTNIRHCSEMRFSYGGIKSRTSIIRRSETHLDTEERKATSFPSKSSYRRSSNRQNLCFATFCRSIVNSRRMRRVKTSFEDRSCSISGTPMGLELSVPVDFPATGKSIFRWIQARSEIDKSSTFESPTVATYFYVERRNITWR